jgi:hypothetical protein
MVAGEIGQMSIDYRGQIEPATLGNDAGIIGTATLALESGFSYRSADATAFLAGVKLSFGLFCFFAAREPRSEYQRRDRRNHDRHSSEFKKKLYNLHFLVLCQVCSFNLESQSQ